MISDKELKEIEQRLTNSQRGPWKSYIEGRDHTSGSNFIMTGEGEQRGEDLEIFGATTADYDFIANAKQDIRKLLDEISRLKN
ncbi:MAG: hypothetical protein QNK23_14265 [Crocinitomicaceae bacterium]|nr:hypothetical protein [Crocinitomicaceae bacterium]